MTAEKIKEWLEQHRDWELQGNSLKKSWQKENFEQALAFVNKIGMLAERLDHHPDILLHSWNRVTVTLSTHSAGGITQNDLKLAAEIDKL